MKILVIGGTGTVGSQVVTQLVERGASVRALVRNNDSAKKLPGQVKPMIGDLLDPVAVRKALEGVDKLYLLNAVVPDELTQGLIAYDLAKELKLSQNTSEDMGSFEEQMRQQAPAWTAFDFRMMFQGYLERGFVAEDKDLANLTALLGHPPRSYQDFAKETTLAWQKE